MPQKQNITKKTALSSLWYISLTSALTLALILGGLGIVAIANHYPGRIELELNLGTASGAVKIDGRPPSTTLPPGE